MAGVEGDPAGRTLIEELLAIGYILHSALGAELEDGGAHGGAVGAVGDNLHLIAGRSSEAGDGDTGGRGSEGAPCGGAGKAVVGRVGGGSVLAVPAQGQGVQGGSGQSHAADRCTGRQIVYLDSLDVDVAAVGRSDTEVGLGAGVAHEEELVDTEVGALGGSDGVDGHAVGAVGVASEDIVVLVGGAFTIAAVGDAEHQRVDADTHLGRNQIVVAINIVSVSGAGRIVGRPAGVGDGEGHTVGRHNGGARGEGTEGGAVDDRVGADGTHAYPVLGTADETGDGVAVGGDSRGGRGPTSVGIRTILDVPAGLIAIAEPLQGDCGAGGAGEAGAGGHAVVFAVAKEADIGDVAGAISVGLGLDGIVAGVVTALVVTGVINAAVSILIFDTPIVVAILARLGLADGGHDQALGAVGGGGVEDSVEGDVVPIVASDTEVVIVYNLDHGGVDGEGVVEVIVATVSGQEVGVNIAHVHVHNKVVDAKVIVVAEEGIVGDTGKGGEAIEDAVVIEGLREPVVVAAGHRHIAGGIGTDLGLGESLGTLGSMGSEVEILHGGSVGGAAEAADSDIIAVSGDEVGEGDGAVVEDGLGLGSDRSIGEVGQGDNGTATGDTHARQIVPADDSGVAGDGRQVGLIDRIATHLCLERTEEKIIGGVGFAVDQTGGGGISIIVGVGNQSIDRAGVGVGGEVLDDGIDDDAQLTINIMDKHQVVAVFGGAVPGKVSRLVGDAVDDATATDGHAAIGDGLEADVVEVSSIAIVVATRPTDKAESEPCSVAFFETQGVGEELVHGPFRFQIVGAGAVDRLEDLERGGVVGVGHYTGIEDSAITEREVCPELHMKVAGVSDDGAADNAADIFCIASHHVKALVARMCIIGRTVDLRSTTIVSGLHAVEDCPASGGDIGVVGFETCRPRQCGDGTTRCAIVEVNNAAGIANLTDSSHTKTIGSAHFQVGEGIGGIGHVLTVD